MIIGLLHPGQMGAAVAARLVAHGHTVLWNPEGRSPATRDRASDAMLQPAESLSGLLSDAELVLSIVPASAAESVAELVADHGYNGVYVDANATSPRRMQRIHELLDPRGTEVIDAVISGPPPRGDTSPRIYLAGGAEVTAPVRDLLTHCDFLATELSESIGAASALKMALASYLRTNRLLVAIAHALADEHGITSTLIHEAEQFGADALTDRAYLSSVAARAWRWEAEMGDIAETLEESGIPTQLADASGELYHRLAAAKDQWSITPEEALQLLKQKL
ncbi:NAD(P)-dependent oxidoreductase [Nocardia higoensis]|uniref:NAD(P)-dependent oxidoreductase n=1 Tax=Nocardia higoensis TaxID=228599 RepID=A0ABS0DCF3_9NOCA|nr:NAD(P)-binding domain-containing protein [Nocardia higoensis]MBF6355262.1 NAD(P)-dependent oxidoreductase [Nocardia higoensis]